MKRFVLLTVASSVFASALPTSHAQSAAQAVDSDQQRRLRERALQPGDTVAESYEGEVSDVGPLRVIRLPERRNWFSASADVQYFRTDNMFYMDTLRQTADVLVSTVEFAVAPSAFDWQGGKLSPRVGFRNQWYDFGLSGQKIAGYDIKLNQFDFYAQTVFAGASWARGAWTFGGGLDYMRMVGTASGDENYAELSLHWSAARNIALCEKTLLTLGYDGDCRWTDTKGYYPVTQRENLDRTDHALGLTLTHRLCSHAFLQPYYRFQFTHFNSSPGRDDYEQTVGTALHLPLNKYISLRLFAAYDVKSVSGATGFDYGRFDTGGAVNVTFRF